MNNRTLGRTGLKISEVGYGSWGLGKEEWHGADDSESLKALHRAFDLGLNFVDTALAYGGGHSERIVGRAVRDKKDVTVASKIPPKNLEWPARRDARVEEVFPAAPSTIWSATAATIAPIGSISTPSASSTVAMRGERRMFLRMGRTTVGPVTITSVPNRSDRLQLQPIM